LDVDSWLGVLLIVSAALVLVLTSAAAAAGIFAARSRPRLPPVRTPNRPDHLHEFAHERSRLLSELVLARTICIVVGSLAAAGLVIRHTGVGFRPLLLTAIATVAVVGVLEGIPRAVVSSNPDRWSRYVRPITAAISGAMLVPAYLIDLPAQALLRLPSLRPAPRDPEEDDEELIRLVELEESQGGIEEDERQMIKAVIELEDTTAREIMVPRMDITAVDTNASLAEVTALIAERGYSRIPLFEQSIDNVVGVIYAKDVLAQLAKGSESVDLRTFARPPVFVPETKRVDELLAELRARRIHIAIVVDEYGGTAGLLTIEDLVEEIVGEIEDEYDQAEPTVVQTDEGDAVVDARASVDLLKDLFNAEIEAEEFDTIAGLIIHQLGKIPAVNDTVDVDGVRLQVLSLTGRRVRKVRVSPLKHASAPQPGP
jgi:CBS domain containing-hemolysin-like protein